MAGNVGWSVRAGNGEVRVTKAAADLDETRAARVTRNADPGVLDARAAPPPEVQGTPEEPDPRQAHVNAGWWYKAKALLEEVDSVGVIGGGAANGGVTADGAASGGVTGGGAASGGVTGGGAASGAPVTGGGAARGGVTGGGAASGGVPGGGAASVGMPGGGAASGDVTGGKAPISKKQQVLNAFLEAAAGPYTPPLFSST